MSDVMKELIVRVLCVSLICTGALIFAGDGAQKEPVRLCCAGIMIIVLFTPLSNKIPDIDMVINGKNEMEEYINDELKKVNAAQFEEVCDKTTQIIKNQVYNIADGCDIDLEYGMSKNAVVVKMAVITGAVGTNEKIQISALLTDDYSVDRDSIFFVEESQ